MSSKQYQKKTNEVKAIFSGKKKILIFNHFNPDPDSITSSFILSEIAKHFNVKSKIVYSGKISHSKNLAMMIYLNFNFYPYQPGEEKKYDLTAIVDSQKGMSNNSVPENLTPDLTFDHHPRFNYHSKEKKFLEIKTRYGSAATILLEYYLNLGIPLNTRIATAFCYTIIAETGHFTRKYNSIDVKFYRIAVQKANLRLISKIENTKQPVAYFKILEKALSTHKHHGRLITCNLGNIKNLDFLHEIANLILTMDGIDFVILTGIADNIKKVCCRSYNPKVHLGNILKAALQGIGSGGGHETMAAGEFTISEVKVIEKILNYLKKFEVI